MKRPNVTLATSAPKQDEGSITAYVADTGERYHRGDYQYLRRTGGS